MPIYKYECTTCGYIFTKLQKISEGYPISTCCENSSLQRLISNTSFYLAGNRWYNDNYGGSITSANGDKSEISGKPNRDEA